MPNFPSTKPIRWQVGARIFALGVAVITWVRWKENWAFQKRNLISIEVGLVTVIALAIWWLFLSRAAWRLRLRVMAGIAGVITVFFTVVRVPGVSGDLVPEFDWRWSGKMAPVAKDLAATGNVDSKAWGGDFPQFYGPDRTGVLTGPKLASDWAVKPPQVLWRKAMGAGWSGFVVVGDVCVTQEQRGDNECVVAMALATGEERWFHADPAHYQSIIAGDGPRATPTISGDRVYTLGSTGILNCLDVASGKRVWSRDVVAEVKGKPSEWGVASSPLIVDDLVVVHGGEKGSHSLIAYRTKNGEVAWKGGTRSSYATPVLATVAGVRQILAFHDGSVSAHDPKTGATLWERPWGNGNVVCASPIVIGDDRVLFSSGYGVGAELLQITRSGANLTATSLWQSTRMKAKFSHLFARDGCVFGLDDGLLACADLKDGSRHWREGRYGHGQGLVVGEHYLLMAESGELVLLHPTPEAPNELARLSVLKSKTWNPIALAGNLLLVRNDREAVCLKIPVVE